MKLNIQLLIVGLCLFVQQINSQNKKWTSGRADGHAPIGVMGDHVHHKGGLMVSYRFMNMEMSGNLSGDTSISSENIIEEGYMVAPKEMTMNMHMLGLMYAPSDKITLYAMGNILQSEMGLKTKMKEFDTESQGFGDLKIGALYQLFNMDRETLHLNLGVSFPTGSLTETGVTPMSEPNETRLGYAMQLGSGTYDVNLGATYLKQYNTMSYGFQTSYLCRIGENLEGYSFGDKWNTTFWTAYSFSKSTSASVRLNYDYIQSLDGADASFMNPMMATVFDTSNSGRQQLDISVGGNFAFFKETLKGLRLAGEFGIPLYQFVEGIQMDSQFNFTLGLQYSLGRH
ncbi:transporter [Flavicella sp.]|uniref:transporter n=1 Tax=Flavicella sp. TaxID=2957742 RepID=UPI003016DD8C